MALPGNLTTREIVGQYLGLSGVYMSGVVEFTIEPILTDGDAGVVIIPTSLIAELDATGSFSIFVLTTDDPDVNPTGFRYKVVEKLVGANGRTFYLDVPGNSSVPIDLSRVVVPGEPATGATTYVNLAALTAEQAARIAGDATNASSVTAEATARQNGDTTLTNNLAAEVTARTAGDTAQQSYTDTKVALYVPLTQRAAANGVATLDSGTKIPTAQIPSLSSTYILTSRINAASGVVGLDASSKMSASQLPDTFLSTSTRNAANGVAGLDASSKILTSAVPDISATYLTVAQKAAASGVASLDAGTKVPVAQIPDLSSTYLTAAQKAAASGVASLDSGTKVPVAQIPDLSGTYIPLSQKAAASGVAPLGSDSKVPALYLPDPTTGDFIPTSSRGAANGVASLDASTLIPTAQIPSLSATYVAVSTRGVANGVATLDASTLVPLAQLPRSNEFGPQDSGFTAWSFDPACTDGTGQSLFKGYIYFSAIVIRKTVSLSNLWYFNVGFSGGSVLNTNSFGGLYDSSGTRVAVTNAINTRFVATNGTGSTGGSTSLPLTGSYSAAPGTYWVAILLNGTYTDPGGAYNGPMLARGASAGTPTAGGARASGNARHMKLTATGQTSMPSSFDPAAGVTWDANAIWAAVS